MDFGSIMGDLATNAGLGQIAGAQQQQRQAQADDTRAQAQMRQMSALSMKQDVADRKAITDETAAASDAFQKSAKTAADVQKLATTKEGAAMAHNQFDMAKSYGEMAKMAEAEQQSALKNKAEEVHQKNESVANAAGAYEAVPSTENAKALAEQAIAAGQKNVPATGTPEFASWAVAQKTAAMDSGKKLEWAAKEADIKANQERLKQKQEQDHADKLERERQTAAYQSGVLDLKKTSLQLIAQGQQMRHEDAVARREEAAAKHATTDGSNIGKVEQRGADSLIRSSSQVRRVVDNMMATSIGASGGLFEHLKDETAAEALIKSGTLAITPQEDQMISAMGAEMGAIGAQMLTVGSGRGPNLALQTAVGSIATSKPTDPPLLKLFRLSNFAELAYQELRASPKGGTKELEEIRQDNMEAFRKLPSPSKLLRLVPHKDKAVLMGEYQAQTQKTIAAQDSSANPSLLDKAKNLLSGSTKPDAAAPYSDAEKESRYQAWKAQNANK